MASSVPVKKMKRSKSLNCLVESEYRCESEGDRGYAAAGAGADAGDDSGVQADGCSRLERKVDRLSDICCEQTRVLAELAAQVRGRGRGAVAGELAHEGGEGELLHHIEDRETSGESGARSLLDAIEARPNLERRVTAALTELLTSEDLKQRIVSATAACIKEQIKSLFSSEVSALYVPVVERAHRRLLGHVSRAVAAAFADLEESTACNVEALRQTAQSLQTALQRHESVLQRACAGAGGLHDAVARTTEKVIERELKQWREEMLSAVAECESARAPSLAPAPAQPRASSPAPAQPRAPSPASPELSPVDRMMITAEVEALARAGDVCGALGRALLAADLRVLAAACRAALHALPACAPLPQPVLLSLLQQLATDLLTDTQLKCSYLEYALGSLQPAAAPTRAHLPLVARELRTHLAAFLRKYPHHTQAARIAAIIDSAQNLL